MKRILLLAAVSLLLCGTLGARGVKTLREGTDFRADTTEVGDFIRLTLDGPTDIVLDARGGAIRGVDIRPVSRNIACRVEEGRLRLLGVTPCKIAVTFNDDPSRPVYLFADPPAPKEWRRLPADAVRFGPGVHEIGTRVVTGRDRTFFLEEGAVLRGCIYGKGATNVRILGYGVIDGRGTKRGTRFERCEGVEIDGPVVLSCNGWSNSFFECRGVTLRNLKVLSSQVFSDGIDLLATSDVLVDDIFIRNEDDCISIKTKKFGFSGNAENIVVRNSTFWSGRQGNALEIGWELDAEWVRRIRFENIDIIRKGTADHLFKRAALSIHHIGNAAVSDVLYRDIRIESVEENLVWIELIPAGKWGSGGGSVENVRFERVSYLRGREVPVVIRGGGSGAIRDVVFRKFRYLGRPVSSADDPLFRIENAQVTVEP